MTQASTRIEPANTAAQGVKKVAPLVVNIERLKGAKQLNSAKEEAPSVVDVQGYPLIPFEHLPFVGLAKRGKETWLRGHWCVDVPEDYEGAKRFGREMALAFLRSAPRKQEECRHSHLTHLAFMVLSSQQQAMENGGTARVAVMYFWETVTEFAVNGATRDAVERCRTFYDMELRRGIFLDANIAAIRKRDRSEASKKAAKTRKANLAKKKSAQKGRAQP